MECPYNKDISIIGISELLADTIFVLINSSDADLITLYLLDSFDRPKTAILSYVEFLER